MSGKSTYLRQNAHLILMAQIGGFVPAESATIGIVDRLFSRIGASDDLAEGRSTFMVEMVETAAILNQATENSFVILDEIGRGTATFDGLSIAWAAIEYLHHQVDCRTLFATHYHELTALADRLDQMVCMTIKTKQWQDDIIFLHEVVPGTADGSYGIHVAKIAGLPESVTKRAHQILTALEEHEAANDADIEIDDLPLFDHDRVSAPDTAGNESSPLADKLAEINPDHLTPIKALEAMYTLKKIAEDI
jgi:DNA mismatch repair protein MutS